MRVDDFIESKFSRSFYILIIKLATREITINAISSERTSLDQDIFFRNEAWFSSSNEES